MAAHVVISWFHAILACVVTFLVWNIQDVFFNLDYVCTHPIVN